MSTSRSRPDIGYLTEIAGKYGVGDLQIVQKRDAAVNRLNKEDIAALARVYDEIERREDAPSISLWLSTVPLSRAPELGPVYRLFLLFEELAERGIPPFSNRAVRLYPDPPRRLDWDKLPKKLHYLIEPALKYGTYQGSYQIEQFAHVITEDQRQELDAVAKASKPDLNEIWAWIDRYPFLDNPESALIYYMLGVIDCLEIGKGST